MKVRIFALLLCVCMLLSACVASPVETRKPGEAAVKAVYDELPTEHSYYQYGNMQMASSGSNFARYGDKVVFWGAGDESEAIYALNLYSYDLNTGKVQRFCGIADCEHTGLECENLFLPLHNLEYYDGKLYNHGCLSPLYVREGDRWEPLEIYETAAWHAYGDLYTMKDGAVKVYYDGKGEPRTILHDYFHTNNVVFGRYMYSTDPGELVRVDLLADNPSAEVLLEEWHCMVDGDHIYYIERTEEKKTYYLYRCAMDGSNRELLLDQPVLPASLNFDDEYIYFRLYTDHKISGQEYGKDIYRMSKADPTQLEKIATLPSTAYMIYTVPGEDVIFVTTWGVYKEGHRYYEIYMVKRDGSGWALMELP